MNPELSTENDSVFSPLEFYPDYYVLKFEIKYCTTDSCLIYTDKFKTSQKWIGINIECFRAENWDSFFRGSMVATDFSTNPLKEFPTENASSLVAIENLNEVYFTISDIQGDWVKIECQEICGTECVAGIVGWIRWRKDDELKIGFPSAC